MSWSSWGWDVLSSVANTTNQIVSDLAEAIDVPDQERKEKPQASSENNPNPEEVSKSDGEKPTGTQEPPQPTPQKTMEFNSPLLSFFVGKKPEGAAQEDSLESDVYDMLSSGASFLGNTFQKGVDTLQNTEVPVGAFQSIAEVGFGALETIGAAALSVLTTEEGPADKPKMKPIWTPILEGAEEGTSDAPKQERTEKKVVTNNQGKSQMEKLEHYSIECMMKTQKTYHKLESEQRDSFDEIIEKIQDCFEVEPKDDQVESMLSVKLDEEASQLWNKLNDSFKDQKSKVDAKIEEFTTELNNGKSANLASVGTLANHFLDTLQTDCVSHLNTLTTDCVQQFEKTASWILKEKGDEKKAIQNAQYVAALTKHFDKELTSVSELWISSLDTVIKKTEALEAVPAVEGEAETAKADLIALLKKKVNEKVSGLRSKIYLSVSNGISNIEEAKKFLLPICKFLIFGPFFVSEPGSETDTEEKKETEDEEKEREFDQALASVQDKPF